MISSDGFCNEWSTNAYVNENKIFLCVYANQPNLIDVKRIFSLMDSRRTNSREGGDFDTDTSVIHCFYLFNEKYTQLKYFLFLVQPHGRMSFKYTSIKKQYWNTKKSKSKTVSIFFSSDWRIEIVYIFRQEASIFLNAPFKIVFGYIILK